MDISKQEIEKKLRPWEEGKQLIGVGGQSVTKAIANTVGEVQWTHGFLLEFGFKLQAGLKTAHINAQGIGEFEIAFRI